MAHRGRLNVLAHIVDRPYETIFAEFEGGRHVEETLTPEGGTGDVKYHHGAEGAYKTSMGKSVTVTLSPNPSHLEVVDPVVEGRARAEQTTAPRPRGAARRHGGAAGADPRRCRVRRPGRRRRDLQPRALQGYSTGGTIHLIANNQVGFTTDPRDARSTDYASDLAKGFDVPIIHVNADDPEACLAAVRLAMMYRAKFHGDVLIDLVGYRRHGHNEGDEPSYTQPHDVRDDPASTRRCGSSTPSSWSAKGVIDAAEAQAEADAAYATAGRDPAGAARRSWRRARRRRAAARSACRATGASAETAVRGRAAARRSTSSCSPCPRASRSTPS